MKKKRVLDPRKIRIGHTVRILIPKFFKRVGYDIVYKDTRKDILDSNDQLKDHKLIDIIDRFSAEVTKYQRTEIKDKLFNLTLDYSNLSSFKERAKNLVINEITYNEVAKRMVKGDQRRKKYEIEIENMKGESFEVTSKKTIKTGTRVAPSGGAGPDYDGEYGDWDPGGLENEKTHVILKGEFSEDRIDAAYTERVITADMVQSQGWLKRYYHILSLKQKADILRLFSVKGTPLAVEKIWEIAEYMKNDLISLILLKTEIRTLLAFMKDIDIDWVLDNNKLFEEVGYSWITNKLIKATIFSKQKEEERVLNKSF